MNRNTTSDETKESLTHVDVADLTEYELREVIPSCDHVVVGYDSSYSDKPVSTKRVVDPTHSSELSTYNTVRGTIVGEDATDGTTRQIGFGKGPVHTSTASGRIGSTLFVEYPAPEPDKTVYTVTFRALAGNYSTSCDDVDTITEYAVDKYDFDDVEAPPEDERRIEDVPIRPRHNDDGVRTERRAVVDVPVTLTIADPDTTDRDDVVERARQTHLTATSWYDAMEYRDDLPGVHDDANRYDRRAGDDSFVRENTRYIIEDVAVDATPIE